MNPTDEQVNKAYETAPQPVRAMLDSEDAIPSVITDIGSQRHLHIDVSGKIAELTRDMLLGLVSPSQFLGGLLVAGIPEPEAREIMKEINEKIFKPLQEEMRKGPAEAGQAPARPVSAPQPAYVPPPPPSYGPPPPVAQVRPAQMRTAESDLAAAIAHAKEHPPTATPATPAAAPLPPRGALPHASPPAMQGTAGAAVRAPGQPIYHHPLPVRPPQPEVPPNLPTGAPQQYGGGTSTEEFPPLPPLVKPPTAPLSSAPEDAFPPHTRYPNDPYREPLDGA